MNWMTPLLGRRKPSRRPSARRLQLAELEAREVPATVTWTGASTSFWSQGANWAGGVAPAAGDDLVFPAGTVQEIVVNDLADGISLGSIQIEDPGYNLQPDSGGAHSIVLTGGFTTTYNTGSAISGLAMQLDSGAVTVAAGGSLSFTGVLTGTSGLTLSGGGTLELFTANTFSGTTTVSAGTLQLATTGAVGGGDIVVASGATLELANGVDVGVPLTVSGTGVGGVGAIYAPTGLAIVSETVTLGASARVGAGAGAALNFTWPIDDGASTFDLDIQSAPTGTVVLLGDNLFDGDVYVREGYVQALGDKALGDPATSSNVVVEDGATLHLGGGFTLPATKTLIAQGNGANGGVDAKFIANGVTTVAGPVVLQSNVLMTVGGGATLTLAGPISEGVAGRNLLKAGAGTLVLDSASGHSGGTFVNAGTLAVNGDITASTGVTVANGATLTGTGTVPNVTVNAGGALAPGQGGPGILTTGNVSLNAGATFVADLNGLTAGTQYDRATATGSMTLNGGNLSLNLGFSPTSGNSFTILENDGADAATGTFNGLAEGATFTAGGTQFRISYVGGNGNDVVLTALGTTTTTLSPSSNPSVFGQAVTLTATVTGTGATPTGTVDFYDGTTLLGTGTLSGGVATVTVSSLAVGTHTLRADYLGQGSDLPSSSTSSTQTVNQAGTTAALTAAPDPSVFGQAKTLTATVTAVPPGAGTPTGTVDFYDGATLIGSATTVGGVATLTTSGLVVGTHSLTAVYSGDAHFTSSTSPVDTTTVTQAATTATLTAAPDPSAFGQAKTLTATVTAVPPGSGMPTGTVDFFDGATLIGTATLVGGTASLTTSALSVGTHALTAVFSGDADFTGSTSPVDTVTVAQAATTATLTAAPDPSVFGQAKTLTATVTAIPPGAGTPTGTVSFFDGATLLGTATVSGGVATFTTSALSVGTHALTAVYSGDADFTGSTSPVDTVTVTQAATGVTLTTAPDPSVFGEAKTLTATVTATPPGSGTPTGTVSFFDGATLIGTAPLVGGVASFTTSSLGVGSHSLTVVYSGDVGFTGSTSPVDTVTVAQAATTATLTTAPDPSVFGQVKVLTATVTAVAPAAGTPTGTVSFFDGATLIGTAVLSGGVGTLVTSGLSVGSHSLTVVYSGDADFTGSTSPVDTVTVTQAATTAFVTVVPDPSVFGQVKTLTATVMAVPPGAGMPSGTVSFFDGATLLGIATISGGVASLSTSTFAVGSHSITVVYSGDADFTGSTSPVHTVTVTQAATATTLTAAPDPTVFGEAKTLTVTVTAVAPGAGTLTGTVSFFDGATLIGSATTVGGVASFTTSSFAVGTHAVTAVFSGDADFTGSTSPVAFQTVNAAGTATVLTPATPAPQVGHAFGLAVSVSAVAPGAGVPTGTVSFFDGATLLGVAPLVGGSATFSATLFGAGTHTVSAVYNGDGSFASSTAAAAQPVLAVAGDVNGDGIADTAVGMRARGSQVVVISGADQSVIGTYNPFGTFKGGVQVALGDVNGDGQADIIVGAGAGGKTQVKVFSGADDSVLAAFIAYNTAATGPVRVAAGDVDGDGKADIITGATSRVKVFSGADRTVLADFLPYGTNGHGVRVAAGDVDGDGKADVVTSAGPGGGPKVKVYSGDDFSLMTQISAFPSPTLGLTVAAGDVDGDGKADIVVGHGKRVKVFSGEDRSQLADFPAYTGAATVTVSVAVRDLDEDGKADIITGAPESFGSGVKVFGGADFSSLDAYRPFAPTFRGGVTVG